MEKGFRAYVDVYDETFYVDTYTGEGYDKVFSKIENLICREASLTYINGYTFEDIKSELIIIAIEGIRSFNPHMGIKLSTFLQTHIHNKKISKIKSKNKLSNDAFGFKDKKVRGERKMRVSRGEINFSAFSTSKGGVEAPLFESLIPCEQKMYASSVDSFDAINFEVSLMKLASKLDKDSRRIIELIYFEDYLIKELAKEFDISVQGMSLRLKALARKRSFQSVFGRLNTRALRGKKTI